MQYYGAKMWNFLLFLKYVDIKYLKPSLLFFSATNPKESSWCSPSSKSKVWHGTQTKIVKCDAQTQAGSLNEDASSNIEKIKKVFSSSKSDITTPTVSKELQKFFTPSQTKQILTRKQVKWAEADIVLASCVLLVQKSLPIYLEAKTFSHSICFCSKKLGEKI